MSTNGHVDLEALPIEQRVRALRKTLGWTQEELAEEVGLSVRQIKRYDAGAIPSEETAIQLARVAPRKLKAKPELFFEPVERKEERLLVVEKRMDALERRLKRAGL